MPEITMSIPCEKYLKQWFINNSGGSYPVKLRKNSPEQHLLRCILAPKSSSFARTQNIGRCHSETLEIIIPYFRGMPPETYNCLSERGQRAFTDILRKRFDLQLFSDLAPVLNAVDRRDELIYAWMEANGIEDDEKNWCAVEKRLRRMTDRLAVRQRVAKFRKKTLI